MKRDEMYSPEFIENIQTLKADSSDQNLFCKLLVSFFAISDYINIYHNIRYTYNAKKVIELVDNADSHSLTEDAAMLQMFFKVMFKVTKKEDFNNTEVSMTNAIVDTFSEMINLVTALQSLDKISEVRDFDRKEKILHEKMLEAMKKTSGTRNHIISELVKCVEHREAVYKTAEKDDLDIRFIRNSIGFLSLLLQFNESN